MLKLRGHVTNVTSKVHENENSRSQITLSHSYVATSGKLREKSSVLHCSLRCHLCMSGFVCAFVKVSVKVSLVSLRCPLAESLTSALTRSRVCTG